jgi:hypothetical protein
MSDFSITGFQPAFFLGSNHVFAKLRSECNAISHQIRLSSCANYFARWSASNTPLWISELSFKVEGTLCV